MTSHQGNTEKLQAHTPTMKTHKLLTKLAPFILSFKKNKQIILPHCYNEFLFTNSEIFVFLPQTYPEEIYWVHILLCRA